jgi:hypothetical protein
MDPRFSYLYILSRWYSIRSAKFHLCDRVHFAEDIKAVTEKGDFWRIVVTEHDYVPKRIGKPGQKYKY